MKICAGLQSCPDALSLTVRGTGAINEPKLTDSGCESMRRSRGWQMPRHVLDHHLIIFLDSGYAYRSLSLSLSECWLSATVPRVTKEMLNVLIRSSEITKGAPAENGQS